MTTAATIGVQAYFHGAKADLKPGELIKPGFATNYDPNRKAGFVYLTATMDAAVWGAELAGGDGPPRIYVVEPTGPLEDDPNLTNQKFPGNLTLSYRSRDPLRVIGEVVNWNGHPAEQLATMKARLAELERQGVRAIED